LKGGLLVELPEIGALIFGVVIGWVTYRTLRRTAGNASISDLAAVIGAVGGGVVTGQFDDPDLFAWYSIGLGVGFFAYLLAMFAVLGKQETGKVMGD
jgi:hypothetical protein